MARAAEPGKTTTVTPPFAKGSIIWEKKGPLPVWGWALIGLALVLLVVWWRRDKAEATANQVATNYTDELPGDQSAPAIFILPPEAARRSPTPNDMPRWRRPPATVPEAPPGSGRDVPPGVVGQWVTVGQPLAMTAAGTPGTGGNTFRKIAEQIWGHADWYGSLTNDPINAPYKSQTTLAPGTRIWVSATPGPNP